MTVPDSIVSDLTASIASVLAGFLPIILMLFGIIIAFYFVRSIVKLFPK
jgi:hypothetical protein